MNPLLVAYCGEEHTVEEPHSFTFGRQGDLQIDDNPYLHRQMGRCFPRDGFWWLANVGAHLPMQLEGQIGSSAITLSPGGSVPLVLGPTTLRFAAGGTSYELEIDPHASVESPQADALDPLGGDSTIDAADMPFTTEQLLLLVALAETRLRRGRGAEIPSNQEIADRFGWSTTKFNRKLDNLCAKFARRGVAGLLGTSARVAQHRRAALVEHVVASRLVTAEQLSLLPAMPGSTPHTRPPLRSLPSIRR